MNEINARTHIDVQESSKKIVRFPRLPPGKTFSTPVSQIKSQSVTWLWSHRIPRGKITILEGDPGQGKSLLTIEIAARVSTGSGLPRGRACSAGDVLILHAEDGAGDTIRPRLEAAGADLDRIHIMNMVADKDGDKRLIKIPDDITIIMNEILRHRAVLLIIDPLVAFLPSECNSWKDQHVRRALAPLMAMAERTAISVTGIRHLNKTPGGKPLYRGGGSIAFIAAARSGLLLGPDPNDHRTRVLAGTKSNLGPLPRSLAFRIKKSDNGAPMIDWIGKTDVTAGDILNETENKVGKATSYLRKLLKDGPMPSSKVKHRTKKAGISSRTLDRAKKQLRIKSVKQGFGDEGIWMWSLRKTSNQ